MRPSRQWFCGMRSASPPEVFKLTKFRREVESYLNVDFFIPCLTELGQLSEQIQKDWTDRHVPGVPHAYGKPQ